MRIDRTTAEADRFNQVWDAHVDGEDSMWETDTLVQRTDCQIATLIPYLESLLPSHSPMERSRLNAHVERWTKEVNRMNTVERASAALTIRKATQIPSTRRNRFVPGLSTFDRFATAALILAILSAFVMAGALRHEFGGNEPGRFAAMLGFEEDESPEHDTGSQSMMTVEVRPSDYEGGRVDVGFWELTLPSGTSMSIPNAEENQPFGTFGFSVSSGSVLFGSGGGEQPVETGGSVSGDPELGYVRNSTEEPARLLVLAPTHSPTTFPLTIGTWATTGSPISPTAASTPQIQPEPVLISSVELNDESAFQYRVLVSDNVLTPGMGIGDVESFGPPSTMLRAITVREGQLAVVPDESLASPDVTGVTQELVPGDTVQLEADGVWNADWRVTGADNARVLGLMTLPARDNHTLDQTVESVAPFWGEWTVPESGQMEIAVRRLILDVGGTYSLPSDAGILYHVVSGTAIVIERPTGMDSPVAAGGTVAQIPGAILAFQNPGPDSVELLQAVVSGAQDDVFAAESPDRVGVEWLVQETETITPGDVSLMLEVHQYNGENDGASAGQGSSLVLITSAEGEIEVSRLGGEAEVVTGPGEGSVQPPLGEGIDIEPGGYLLAQPGAGWGVTGGTGAPSTGLVLSISPNLKPDGTPVATPVATTAGTITLSGARDACDVAPITGDHVIDIVATPATETAPLERSLRGEEGSVSDPDTTDEIVAMLQAYTDCSATDDYTRINAFYSDQAIRDSVNIQYMVEAEYEAGELRRISTTVEDIVLFLDGRAGARTVIDGQPAYLTFGHEDGAWKIDVWDDSGSGLLPGGTPAA